MHGKTVKCPMVRSLRIWVPCPPSPSVLPQQWNLAVMDIKDCFFTMPQHQRDASWFAFSVPSLNLQAPLCRYHCCVLPQGMRNFPTICQWYVAHVLSPVCKEFTNSIILLYVDDILICAPDGSYLDFTLQEMVRAIERARFEI